MMRIARGAGQPLKNMMELMEEFKRVAKVWDKFKGVKIPKNGDMSAFSRNMSAQMSKALPPQILKQIGGTGGLNKMMKTMGNKDR